MVRALNATIVVELTLTEMIAMQRREAKERDMQQMAGIIIAATIFVRSAGKQEYEVNGELKGEAPSDGKL